MRSVGPISSASTTRNAYAHGRKRFSFNSAVKAAVHDETTGTTYVAGGFTNVTEITQISTRLAAITGLGAEAYAYDLDVQNGIVYVVTPDGLGGFYIGGSFTSINNESKYRLAHFDSYGRLDSTFNPEFSGDVRTVAVLDDNDEVMIIQPMNPDTGENWESEELAMEFAERYMTPPPPEEPQSE